MNVTGILISIHAWLPTGKGLDEQFTALSLVKEAHASGDYAPLLAAATIEAVKTESKTRRMEVATPANPTPGDQSSEPTGNTASSSDQQADGTSPMPSNFLGENPHLEEPATHDSNVGDAPVDKPTLEAGEELPNPIKKRGKAA